MRINGRSEACVDNSLSAKYQQNNMSPRRSTQNILPQICEASLPSYIPTPVRTEMARLALAVSSHVKGEVLAHTGAMFRRLYLVVHGAFKSVQISANGQAQVINFHGPRDFMGLGGFAEHTYTTDLIALQQSTICEFPVAEVEALAQRSPALLECLLSQISRNLAGAEHDQFMLGSMTGAQKIADFILRQKSHSDGVLDLPMSREDLGSFLGLTAESVCRLLYMLRDQRIIAVERRRLRVLDRRALEAWAGDKDVLFPGSRRTLVE